MKEFRTGQKGMSYARAKEIDGARQSGETVELSAEEEQQLESIHTRKAETASIINDATKTRKVLADAQRNLDRMMTPMHLDSKSMIQSLVDQTPASNVPIWTDPQPARERENSENIKATAEALQDVAAILASQKEAGEKRDKAAAKEATRIWRATLATVILAALAVVAPFVIEAIKGWQ